MRTLSLVDCIEVKFTGSILKSALCFGDCDNDSKSEFIFGNSEGELLIYRDNKCICYASELGTVAAVSVGDLLNISRNVLVVVTTEGWCHIFDVESELSTPSRGSQDEGEAIPSIQQSDAVMIWPFHSQRMPPNTKCLALGDVNGDGLTEMVLALTDRVVRTYQWRVEEDDKQATGTGKDDPRSEELEAFDGRLFGVNKWELANQVGSLALHKTLDATSILVGQPGGTVQRITETPLGVLISETRENSVSTIDSRSGKIGVGSTGTIVHNPNSFMQHRIREQSISSPVENIVIDYFTLDINHMINQNLSTEVAGNVLSEDGFDNDLYAVGTLDGTIIIAKENDIQWSFQIDHQILSLFQLSGKLLVCTWDGETYMIDGKLPIRFHFEENVAAFVPGLYSVGPNGSNESENVMCMAFVTFNERIYIYPIPESK